MRLPSLSSILLPLMLISTVPLTGQIIKRPIKTIKPLKANKIQAAPETSTVRPEIQSVSVEDSGFDLTWLVVIENKGTTPTPSDMSLDVARESNPSVTAGGARVPVLGPGGTASLRLTLNPDPRIGQYTFSCASAGKRYQGVGYSLSIPTATIELMPTKDASGSQWTARVQNSWVFTLSELKVQVFRKNPSTSAWESVHEKIVGPLPIGTSAQTTGAWDPTVAQYKAVVLMRRVSAEPWVELATITKSVNP
jgi:hypothetical protein